MALGSKAAGTEAAPVKISTVEGFSVGALAAMTAVTVTNPMEVCKTRMQLQGELMSAAPRVLSGQTGSAAPQAGAQTAVGARLYKSSLDCFTKTLRSEGFRGVQRGIGAAYVYQVLLNGSRLGFYEPFRKAINKAAGKRPDEQWAAGAFAAGASSGCVGAILGNPLFLIKARIQAYSPHFVIGKASHNYKSTIDGLSRIFKEEGFRGLVRGMDAAVLRTAMGSTVQLPAYNWFKGYLTNMDVEANPYNPLKFLANKPNSFFTYLASSIFSGLCVCAVMQPADTALTRMYNQPVRIDERGRSVGTLYRNPFHCLYLTAKAEGVLGWYKGTTAHLFRIAPHTVLTLVMNEAYLRWYTNFKAGRSLTDTPAVRKMS
ncbi:mitochondrial carrier [Testicularia cyperi]|uniref:Mitochondrial carrier n=1 Tax=Testicularia cyperi TaxID=1882483 RepID=A0A317XNM0_9BASI|nr:mitochondrial carrier [Testicularia cyperi]